MRRVIIESPFRGRDGQKMAETIGYARDCIIDSLARGEAPFASHGFYTQFLSDNNPEEREFGIRAGLAWMKDCDAVIVYRDLGISEGMERGIEEAERLGKPIEYRWLVPAKLQDVK